MGRRRAGKAAPGGAEGAPGKPSPVPRLLVDADEEIDLHGMTVAEALAAAEMALGRHRSGATLRLIHGHSSGDQGSIRGAVRRALETVWRKKVKSFRPEPGNPGATLVLLA